MQQVSAGIPALEDDLDAAEPLARTKEVRVALVLYGGVSLAVYINGTAREFFDLVRGRGVWGLVQELAGADVTVDVISGASAGGINGLFLAYALCSEREFQPLETLWRDRGGFQRLVRRADETEARSLLDSAYMDRELQLAFEAMDRKPCERRGELGRGGAPAELDCFLAVTNFDGHAETLGDFRNRPIQVKSHAARLHVKHRKGRFEPLSGRGGRAEALSSRTLASFARATSAFPVAFEPVVLRGEEVGKFFDHRGPYLENGESAVFIDGGVLDNKPFTPLLPAIYQRHATRPVERVLFFVEPDPPEVEAAVASETAAVGDGPNFFQVAIASLSSLPGYESIADDLQALDRHNRRLDLLRSVFHASNGDGIGRGEPLQGWEEEVYKRARLQGLMETLASELTPEGLIDIETDVLGTPGDGEDGSGHRRFSRLFETLFERLASPGPSWNEFETHFDIGFYRRAFFYWIYRLYEEMETLSGRLELAEDGDEPRAARARIAQLSSTLRFLSARVDMLSILEAAALKAVHEWSGSNRGSDSEAREKTLAGLLETWQQHSRGGADVIGLILGRGESAEGLVDRFADRYRERRGEAEEQPLLPAFLEALRNALEEVDADGDDTHDARDAVESFRRIDARRYPAMLLSNLGEMDRIDYVRISARDSAGVKGSDPALGRWDDEPMTKVTGRQLGHFGAFLKRSWRSNDILWGRQDAATVLFDTLLLKNGGKLRLSRRRARDLLDDDERMKRVHPAFVPWLESFVESDGPSYDEQCRKLLRVHQQEIYRDGLCTVIADAVHEEIARKRTHFDFDPPQPVRHLARADGRSHDERFQVAVVETLRQFRGQCRDPLLRKITEETLPSRAPEALDRFFAEHYRVGEERLQDLDPIDLTTLGLHTARVLSNMTQRLLPSGRIGSWLNRKVIGKATLGLTTLHLAVGSIRTGTFPILWCATLLASAVLLALALFTDTIQISAWIPGGMLAVLLMAPRLWFGQLHRVRWVGLFFVLALAVLLAIVGRQDARLLADLAGGRLDWLTTWVQGLGAVGSPGSWASSRIPLAMLAGGAALGGATAWWWAKRRHLRRGMASWWSRLRNAFRRRPGETAQERAMRSQLAELQNLERQIAARRRRADRLRATLGRAAARVGQARFLMDENREREAARPGRFAMARRWLRRVPETVRGWTRRERPPH